MKQVKYKYNFDILAACVREGSNTHDCNLSIIRHRTNNNNNSLQRRRRDVYTLIKLYCYLQYTLSISMPQQHMFGVASILQYTP